MYPPVFETIKDNAGVQAVLGRSPRVYPFGKVPPPPHVVRPYAVFRTLFGSPENYLSGRPNIDGFTTQIDVYGLTEESVQDATRALRDALELAAYVVRWGEQSIDTDTNLRKFDFDVDWLTPR